MEAKDGKKERKGERLAIVKGRIKDLNFVFIAFLIIGFCFCNPVFKIPSRFILYLVPVSPFFLISNFRHSFLFRSSIFYIFSLISTYISSFLCRRFLSFFFFFILSTSMPPLYLPPLFLSSFSFPLFFLCFLSIFFYHVPLRCSVSLVDSAPLSLFFFSPFSLPLSFPYPVSFPSRPFPFPSLSSYLYPYLSTLPLPFLFRHPFPLLPLTFLPFLSISVFPISFP